MAKPFGWCILILTLSVSYEVFVRYVLNAPRLSGPFDMMVQMYGALFLMAGPYALAQDTHVRGDVLYRLFSGQSWQATRRFRVISCSFSPACWRCSGSDAEIAADSWRYKEVSWNSPARIQIYFFKTLIPVAGVLADASGHCRNGPLLAGHAHGAWLNAYRRRAVKPKTC